MRHGTLRHGGGRAWFAISTPFAFGLPEFHVMPVVIMLLSMVIIVAETTGNCLAIGGWSICR